MYIGNHLPNGELNTQIFYKIMSSAGQKWLKPPGATLIQIICISGGAGGGAGATRIAGQNGGGGGGGGCGSISRMLLDASVCPDYLETFVGYGGKGGVAGGAVATVGQGSYVAIPLLGSWNSTNSVLCISTAGANAGGAGTTTVGGVIGAGGLITVATTFSSLGPFISIAGQAGTLGGYNITTPLAVDWGVLFTSGGAGGGGISTGNTEMAGGNITQGGNPLFETIKGGSIGGGNGNNGITMMNPLPIFTGGAGGGSNATGTGGKGGNGGIGSGGGGGGAGLLGGNGGDGGDGMIIITYV